jgi:glucose/arabinose dehydrogenase
VATKLNSPVGIAVLADETALVGERATGRIVRVQPQAGQPVQTVRRLTVDSAGDGGLLDLALSPTYSEDQLIFAYISTASDNRVVDFTLNGPVTPVFTGIPRGPSGNTGRIVFGADGDLYIGTGDAGTSSNSLDPHSLAGKVLRVSDIGKPAPGNPKPGSPIFASGFKQVDALCADPKSVWLFEAEARELAVADAVSLLIPGDAYGWRNGGIGPGQTLASTPGLNKSPGGCTVDGATFYLTSRDGQSLLSAPFTDSHARPTLGNFTVYLAKKYGRLLSVVAAPDGSLWLTTSNRDGHGKPIPDDERVLHIQQPSQSGHSPA